MRAAAKTVNFAVIYGQTQFALARNLRIARGEAQRYIKAFFEQYAGVRRYLDTLVQEARSTGAVRTLMRPPPAGARHRCARITRSGPAAERIAQNTPIQGSAADIMKTAMIARARRARRSRRCVRAWCSPCTTSSCSRPRRGSTRRSRRWCGRPMEGAVQLECAAWWAPGWGDSWGEAH